MAQPWIWNTDYERVGLTGVVKPEGSPRPRFYFYGYEDFEREQRVFFPLGINWLVQLKRDVLFLFKNALTRVSHLSYREREEWAAYRRGYERGRATRASGASAELGSVL